MAASGFSGDGGPATSAQLANPTGVKVDGAGNLFIADNDNHRVRKVAASTGIISSAAGNGTESFGGDDGLATQAQLNNPFSMAVDAAGNLFIADTDNHRIRQVGPAGDQFTLDDATPDDSDGINQSITFSDILADTYNITETLPSGWQLDSATCTGAGGSISLTDETLSVAVGAGEDVTCTFTNSLQTGTIVIRKGTSPGGGTGFGFTDDIAAPNSFSLDDGQSKTFLNVVVGTYSVSEVNIPAGWNLTSATCDDGSDPSAIGLSAGETVKCIFENTAELGVIIIRKATVPFSGSQRFEFSPSYGTNFTLANQNRGPRTLPGTRQRQRPRSGKPVDRASRRNRYCCPRSHSRLP